MDIVVRERSARGEYMECSRYPMYINADYMMSI